MRRRWADRTGTRARPIDPPVVGIRRLPFRRGPQAELPVKYLIIGGDYDALSGGVMALHLLCDLLNRSGSEAYLCNRVHSVEARPATRFGGLGSVARAWADWHLRGKRRRLVTCPGLLTPVLRDAGVVCGNRDWIVIYPEIIVGNPLAAARVVRWFLHHPGHFSSVTTIHRGELHVRYSDWQRLPGIEGCHAYPGSLRPFAIPGAYGLPAGDPPRSGTAYCLRKGAGRPRVHDLRESVLIDGLSHEQTAEVFRRVKTFISYDLHTTYSLLAVLCGAESVVVPDPALSESEWFAKEENRWGVAYGFDQLAAARATADRQRDRLRRLQEDSLRSVTAFATYAEAHFRAPAARAG